MSEFNLDESLEEAIRLGWMERVGKGKFRLTRKGRREVEDRILPSVGMTKKILAREDGLKDALERIEQRDRLKQGERE